MRATFPKWAKVGVKVFDRWYPWQGSAVITKVLKTKIQLEGSSWRASYDVAHFNQFIRQELNK